MAQIVETATLTSMNLREVKPKKKTGESWTKDGGKKNATSKRRVRSELIIISKKAGMTYADILRWVKFDPELTEMDGWRLMLRVTWLKISSSRKRHKCGLENRRL